MNPDSFRRSAILKLLEERKEAGSSEGYLCDRLGLARCRRPLNSSLKYMVNSGTIVKVFIDSRAYYVLPEFEKTVFAEVENGNITFSDRVAALYAAFGVRMPGTLRRFKENQPLGSW